MAGNEVWNFVNKFHNLRNAGKNALLTLKSENGKVVINLQLNLYDDLPPPHQPRPSRQNRPSPSRIRRTERRARARGEAAAANADASSAVDAVAPSSPTKDAALHAVILTSDVAEQATNTLQDTISAAAQVACAPAIRTSLINVTPTYLTCTTTTPPAHPTSLK